MQFLGIFLQFFSILFEFFPFFNAKILLFLERFMSLSNWMLTTCGWTGCLAGINEKKLLSFLLDKYNTLERPVANESEPVMVSFGLTLQQIIDVDEKNQILTTNAWLNFVSRTFDNMQMTWIDSFHWIQEWNDHNLRWNPNDYGNVRDVRIPPNRIWKPDVLLYNR